ncbi:MAG: MMPL family transporter [Myxococcota bacterium]
MWRGFVVVVNALCFAVARLLVRYRKTVLTLAALVTCVMAGLASRVHFDFSPDSIYLANDAAHAVYVKHFIPHFGDQANVAVVAVRGNLQRLPAQEALVDLHNRLRQHPQVLRVRSVLNLLPQAAKNQRGIPGIQDILRGPAHIYEGLLASNGSAAAIVAQLPMHYGDQAAQEDLARSIKRLVQQVSRRHSSVELLVTGPAFLQEATIGFLKRDQMLFLPFVVLCIALFLWLSFRDVRGVVLPFIATGVATVWALGWLCVVGHSFNIVNNALVVLLLVISIADSVHLFARFQDELQQEQLVARRDKRTVDADAVVIRTTVAMIPPCLLTSCTTALGFASSVWAQVHIVKEFGVDAAVGVMGAFVATFLITPAALRMLPFPQVKDVGFEHKRQLASSFLSEALAVMARFSIRYAKVLVVAAVSLFCLCGWFAKNVQSNQRLISDLPESEPAVVAARFIEKTFFGLASFDILLEGDAQQWQNPEVVRRVSRMSQAIRSTPLAPRIDSFPDALRAHVHAVQGQDPGALHQWSDERIAHVLHQTGEDPSANRSLQRVFFSADGSLQRIVGQLKDSHTRSINQFRQEVQRILDTHRLPHVPVHLTGGALIAAKALGNILRDMAGSLVVACATIVLIIALVFRSVRYAVMALLPNLLPIVVTLAIMQLWDIHLRVATVMIFSMALGISVDACTHLLARLREEIGCKNGNRPRRLQEIIVKTMQGSGRPVVYSTVLLLLGFSVLGLSRFHALRDFAILSAAVLATALLVDLLLLPALVILVRPKR